ncbi:hypothetical protein FDC26_17700 [Clostridium botulinum]|uniref:hypothetical protein n=1 Tax=unclassified Clostridium TaxID=2614128 RepID=UPI0013C7B3FE|nr:MULTISPECIES: hypothetical protein [unclassified Clostridium]NFN78672.1 hypothetical protein [Clostridium botulinum]NFO79212.1 hypothetical protein [Clostridium botulinum]NFP05976.1 hypothetical protein [Clostridium botulinum]NFS02263.1 hypothetical protein [Clostridium botulinum]NFT97352.1 hypothetical protein [Clostridium botulinum]
MNEIDKKVYEKLEELINSTVGQSIQEKWVQKQDIFTCRNLFKEHNLTDKLKEVEEIKKEILSLIEP